MLISTLGGLIKDYRIKKRLSQLEVSLRIGWKDSTRLSKIEQGRVGRPTRPTLDKIMGALSLSEQEKGQMLLTGLRSGKPLEMTPQKYEKLRKDLRARPSGSVREVKLKRTKKTTRNPN